MKAPSKKTILFLSGVTGFSFSIYDDRQKIKKLKEEFTEAASSVARQPIGNFDVPRKATVFIAASSIDEGVKYRYVFDTYVKYIFDAGALDYEVVEAGPWNSDARGRISSLVSKNLEEKRDDGIIAIGRPAFKALVVGSCEALSGVFEYKLDNKDIVVDSNEIPALKKLSWNSWFWSWFGYSTEQLGNEKSESFQQVSIGFIPYKIPSRLNRIFNWFYDKHNFTAIGPKALEIVLKQTVNFPSVFPGDVEFTVEKDEIPEDKNFIHKETKEKQEIEQQEEQQSFLVRENVLECIKLFSSGGEENDINIKV
jgi:hypothetical protein